MKEIPLRVIYDIDTSLSDTLVNYNSDLLISDPLSDFKLNNLAQLIRVSHKLFPYIAIDTNRAIHILEAAFNSVQADYTTLDAVH